VGRNELSSIEDAYALGEVSGESEVGGLIGYHFGADPISRCFSSGMVAGQSKTGGLIGDDAFTTGISSAYWDMETSGQGLSAGGVGLTSAEMVLAATFTAAGWDFAGEFENGGADIWFMPYGYPQLSWIYAAALPIDFDRDSLPDWWEWLIISHRPDDDLIGLEDVGIELDSDEDGLPALKEYRSGTSPMLPDSDFDGYLDGDEVFAGSDALDGTALPKIRLLISATDGLRFRAFAGHRYQVETSISSQPGSWTTVEAFGTFSGMGVFEHIPFSELLLHNPVRFYRIVEID